jgi:hypothetical protein
MLMICLFPSGIDVDDMDPTITNISSTPIPEENKYIININT